MGLAKHNEERRKAIAKFLKSHGFSSATGPKRSMLKVTYPLHCAAEEGNWQIVGMLLNEGVNPAQKNSSGKTTAQVAEKKDKKGSHASVLRLLHSAMQMTGGRA